MALVTMVGLGYILLVWNSNVVICLPKPPSPQPFFYHFAHSPSALNIGFIKRFCERPHEQVNNQTPSTSLFSHMRTPAVYLYKKYSNIVQNIGFDFLWENILLWTLNINIIVVNIKKCGF